MKLTLSKKIRMTAAIAVPAAILACLIVFFQPRLNTAAPPDSLEASAETALVPSEAAPEPAVPEPEPEPAFEEYDISLMALGDNLMHMGIVRTGYQKDGTYNFDFLFENIRKCLDAADISVINQETIFGGNQLGFSGFPYFNSPTEVGDAIADAGFNVVLHATNHAADQGLDGLLNCVSFWEETHPEVLMAGITGEVNAEAMGGDQPKAAETAGTVSEGDSTAESVAENSESSIPLLRAGGITFAILNYTYSPNSATLAAPLRGHLNMLCPYNEKSGLIDLTSLNPQVLKDIEEAKRVADVCIVFPHWGNEYQTEPSYYQRQFAMEMTRAGADLIIGTHPHVAQPVEKITAENGNTALCYYSLGNYVSSQQNPLCMLEEMAWVTFHVTEDGVSIAEDRTGAIPLVCHYTYGPLRLGGVYFLEDYTEEQAGTHGIRGHGGVALNLSDLQTWSREILGSWLLKKSDLPIDWRQAPDDPPDPFFDRMNPPVLH